MKAKFVDTGARRYLTGEVKPFDQKNEMFCRPLWDEKMLDLGEKFYMTPVPPRDQPGFRLKDQAMVNAAWHLENTFAQGVAGGRMGMYAWEWDQIFEYPRVPAGLKIDPHNTRAITGGIKRAAAFFGASLVGVCELDRNWVYASAFPLRDAKSIPNDLPEAYRYAIAIAVEMDYDAIRCSPASPSSAATGLGYSKMAFVAGLLAHHIRGLGYQAITCGAVDVMRKPDMDQFNEPAFYNEFLQKLRLIAENHVHVMSDQTVISGKAPESRAYKLV